ncbi:MAG: hypothetical protein JF599_12895 [Verrucomicrobia bacterium]|nr:hypothetical protein [Verrucomicrobiota bacterium]
MALILLIIATINKTRTTRIVLCSFAILALLAQGGCWVAANGFGRATGGGGNSTLGTVVFFALLVALFWSVVLIASSKPNLIKEERLKENREVKD